MKRKLTQSGYSLIELMITITLGSFLILGAAYAFQEARKTYTTNDNVAQLYEQAQYLTDLLDEDIRLVNFWGTHNKRTSVDGDSNDSNTTAAVETISGDCASQWALDLNFSISGSNQATPAWAGTACAVDFRANTDTLVIKHADYTPIPTPNIEDGQIYIRSDEAPQSLIFLGNDGQPATVTDNARNYLYLAHGYYVANNSNGATGGDNVPTLMRETLVDNGTAPAIETQEILRGVEDLQIQFGIDNDEAGQPGYNVIDRYVNADSPALTDASINRAVRVLSVRFWVLLRSVNTEPYYTNDASYNYATVTNYQPNDGFRRLLVSKTVNLRNM